MHSLNVYDAMMQHFYTEGENAESYAICALLHDLCKANFYKVSTRNVKNDSCPTATAKRACISSSISCT